MKKILFIASIFLANVAQAQIPHWLPSNKLIGWYPFDNSAADLSTHGNNGTAHNVTPATDRNGNANKAYHFNGTTSYVEVPDSKSLRPDYITLSAWVKVDAINGLLGVICNKSNKSNANNENYGFNTKDFGVKQNSNCVAGAGWQISSYATPLNKWLFVASTYDGDTMRTYINDSLVAIRGVKGTIDTCIGGTLRFGYNWDVHPQAFNGTIDDAAIYGRALNRCELRRLYRQNHTGIITQPVDTKAIGGNAQFTITTSGSNLSYQWQEQKTNGAFLDIINGGSYSGAATGTLSITAAGVNLGGNKYRCIVTATGLCPDTSNAAMLEVPNHINDLSKTGVAIYPNPATAKMIITSEALKPGMKYLITDKFGRSVLNGIISGSETDVSVEMLPPGLYFLRIEGTSMTTRMEKL